MPLGGLALANSLATALETAGLLVLMRRRLKGLHGGEIARGLAAGMAATGAMTVVIWFWMQWSAGQRNIVIVAGGVLLGALVYGGLLAALGIREVRLGWTWASRLTVKIKEKIS